jgi:hypothetical protein
MIHVSFPRPHRLGQPIRKAKIERCSNNGWYRDKIGEVVIIEFIDSDGYWSREGGQFNCINVIRKEDATLLPLEN